ncbi:MAG TPA: enoyl-CoA hydratase, partial [Alphaproteobacteria bacterium]|nr:enoyl-CoA hydratase [Alphaproteobacteria bacterium]
MQERYETLELTRPAAGLLQIGLNRPEARNALNTQMGLDLRDVFQDG